MRSWFDKSMQRYSFCILKRIGISRTISNGKLSDIANTCAHDLS